MEMEGDHGLVGEYAARAYAQTVHAVREDESLKADERLELASRYTDRSLEILRRTVAHGFKDLDRMAPGSDLDPVRLDTRFEELDSRPPQSRVFGPD